MATTSSTLVAGKVMTAGQGDNGKGRKGRATAVVATGVLGLSLLTGGLFAQGRQAVSPADAPGVRVNPYWVYAEDVVIDGDPAAAMALVRVNPYWTYNEDVTIDGNPASVVSPAVADPFTSGADRRVETRDIFAVAGEPSCVAASAAGVPGEGCGADPRALPATADTALKYWELWNIWA